MPPEIEAANSLRVLVAAPTRRDADVTCALLERSGVNCHPCPGLRDMATEMLAGVGAVMLTDVAIIDPDMGMILAILERQPGWSDVPVILLTPDRQYHPAAVRVIDRLTNVTVLDRPVSTRSMTSAVLAALRARHRQYEIRDQLEAQRLSEQALRDADKRKDEFLATLAHELRNPLAPIRTGLEVLSMLPPGAEQAPGLREMMQRQLRMLVKLIDDLLDVSRIATGKVAIQRERVDMRDVVDAAVEGSQPAISGGRHHLSIRRPAHPVSVKGDPVRLAQVVGNLIHNAAKYTPQGGHITVEVASGPGEAVVRVTDDGVGIPEPMLEHVFDLFAQVDRTLDRSQGGLGIGLSLVRRLVELHGGTVSAESRGLGLGSTFTIRLPLGESKPAERTASASYDDGQTRGVRVLVVDDNVDAADALATALRLEGHQARVAYSCELALQAAAEFKPEAVVCDVGLPKMDGHEVARRLRCDPHQAGTVLVAVTGWGTEEDKRRTRDAGFDFHLTKPVGLEHVQEILRRL
jgi:signal transduction histidine kinase